MSDIVKDDRSNGLYKASQKGSATASIQALLSNNYQTFVIRKSERLASAIYVITGFMPQEEPVRKRLRVCALELITHSSDSAEFSENGTIRFESRCAEITTILETAKYAGLMSEMNAKLLGEEYATLAGFVRAHASKIAERGHTLERATVSEPRSFNNSIRHKSLIKNDLENRKPYDKNVLNDRKGLIMKLLDTRGSISLKDAVSMLPGVSEKTVQRDLLSLVSEGALSKTGSRRWTTYRKASA